jgi:predicted acetyltransferase
VWFGGVRVRAGGIATVGVAPEARGRGVGARLMEHLHAQTEAWGGAITILYAFRQGFYGRHGYAPASSARRLRVSPHAVPRAWVKLATEMGARAANDSDRVAIADAYDDVASRGTGMIARTERFWDARLQRERRKWFVVGRAGAVDGYVSWTARQAEAHARTTVMVHELVARTDEARRALWGLLGAQRDQVTEVAIEVDARDPIDRALVDADRDRFGDEEVEHALGEVACGPMVRITDVQRALAARGYAHDGALELAVGGETHALVVEAGRPRVETPRGAPGIRLDRRALAAVLYGALAPSDAHALGWLDAPDTTVLARADSLLALPPYFALDPF